MALSKRSSTRRTWPAGAAAVFAVSALAGCGSSSGGSKGSGASGVGRACTESFVMSFIAIIVINFFFAYVSKEMYQAIFGIHSLFS